MSMSDNATLNKLKNSEFSPDSVLKRTKNLNEPKMYYLVPLKHQPVIMQQVNELILHMETSPAKYSCV